LWDSSPRDEVAAAREEAAGLRAEAASAKVGLERSAQESRAAVEAAQGELRGGRTKKSTVHASI